VNSPCATACPRCRGEMTTGQFFGTLPFTSDVDGESSLLKRWLRGLAGSPVAATVMVSALGCRCDDCGYTEINRESLELPEPVTPLSAGA
jgi:C4-type Zn-finger protein